MLILRLARPSLAAFGRFAADRRASMALEFAILVPVFVVLGLLSFSVSTYIRAQSRVTGAAEVVATIVGQNLAVGHNILADACYAAGLMVDGPGAVQTHLTGGQPGIVVGSFVQTVNAPTIPTPLWAKNCAGTDVDPAASGLQAAAQPYFSAGQGGTAAADRLVVAIISYTLTTSVTYAGFPSMFQVSVAAAQYPRNGSQAVAWDATQ